MREWAREPLPLSATAHVGDALYWRLSGNEAAVSWGESQLVGERSDEAIWSLIRDRTHPFFASNEPARSLVCTPATEPVGELLIEWSGARRWCAAGAAADLGERMGARVLPGVGFAPREELAALYRRIKAAFDPAGILNPGLGPDAN